MEQILFSRIQASIAATTGWTSFSLLRKIQEQNSWIERRKGASSPLLSTLTKGQCPKSRFQWRWEFISQQSTIEIKKSPTIRRLLVTGEKSRCIEINLPASEDNCKESFVFVEFFDYFTSIWITIRVFVSNYSMISLGMCLAHICLILCPHRQSQTNICN